MLLDLFLMVIVVCVVVVVGILSLLGFFYVVDLIC